jgi:hypothetical protein
MVTRKLLGQIGIFNGRHSPNSINLPVLMTRIPGGAGNPSSRDPPPTRSARAARVLQGERRLKSKVSTSTIGQNELAALFFRF